MGSEDSEQDQPVEEVSRRKEGSGQIPSGTNPRGAGRPTSEWLEFKREQKEFQAWKEAKQRGEFATSASILERVLGVDKGRGDGDSKGDPQGYLERALKIAGLEKLAKNLKFDKVEDLLNKGWKYVAPYIMPALGVTAAFYIGTSGLYIVEEIDKTDTYTRDEWNALPDKVQLSYHTVNGKYIDPLERAKEGFNWWLLVSPLFIFLPKKDTETGDILDEKVEIVKAKRKVAPQIIHTWLDIWTWATTTTENIQDFLGIDDILPFKMQNMFAYHIQKYFKKLSSLFKDTFDK